MRRYEHDYPGATLHIDLKKLGDIREAEHRSPAGRPKPVCRPGKPRNKYRDLLIAKAIVYTIIDDRSRVAYAEIYDDETAITATTVLVRSVECFNARGVTVERMLSDNGGAYRSHLRRDTCHELNIKHKRTQPYQLQTNGRIERFHRKLADSRLTPAATPPRRSAEGMSMAGCSTTTSTDLTQPAATTRPSYG